MLLIENGTVFTPLDRIVDGAVLVDDRRIEAVGRRGELSAPTEVRRLDAHGGFIAPGFVNMHVHGVGGFATMDAQGSSLHAMAALMARHGVTSFLPTTNSGTTAEVQAALDAVRRARNAQAGGAEILGVHMEGPYVSVQERGAASPESLRMPDPAEYHAWLQYADVIRVFTLAPELPGALELIRALKERGILISAGHSIAIDEELSRAVDAGLSHATHLFCNMGTLRRVNLRRVAGLVESVLLDDRVTAEIIADGYHLAPSLMKLGFKVKGADRLAIVTDGSPLTGLPPGPYCIRGRDVILEEHIVYRADRTAYSGSVATMDQCLRCAVETMDLTLGDALRMASLTPATIIGVADRKGSIAAGMDADIAILDQKLHVAQTIVGGQVSFVREDAGDAGATYDRT